LKLKNLFLLEHREESESQSDYSTTTASNHTYSNQNNHFTDHKRTSKTLRQQHVSIGPTTAVRKPKTLATITNHLSQPPPPTTFESHFNRDQLPHPPVPTRQIRSPSISPRTPSDTEFEDNHSRSTTPTLNQPVSRRETSQTPDSTANSILKHQSTNHNRPPARLEKRDSPISLSPERPIKTKEETDENDAFSFFE
jgi:hypothetical protein